MSEVNSERAARLAERRRRRQQRRNSDSSAAEKERSDEEKNIDGKVNGVEKHVESKDSELRSRSSTDSDVDHRALTREEKRKQRRQKKRGPSSGDDKPVPVISHFGKREIRERKASDADTLSADSGSVASDIDSKRPLSPVSKAENADRSAKKKGGYGSYASAIRRSSTTTDLHKRKEMYAAALEGQPVVNPDQRDVDEGREKSVRDPVVKTFEQPEATQSEGVDSEHVQSVKSLKDQWQDTPKQHKTTPGVNKPKVGIKADKQWIKHVKLIPDEGEAPKEPAWLQTVRHRRWLSTVKARFPDSEEEAQAFEQRSTTPRKFKKSNPYTLMRSKSDLDDEFEAVMNRRRRKAEPNEDKRSLSSYSESDMTDYGGGTLNKVPIQGPLKEYQKNLSLERSRKTMLNWTFSAEAVDDPCRFDLPKPIDLFTSEDYEREQEWAFEQSRRKFGGGDATPPLRSSSHASMSSLSDEGQNETSSRSPHNMRSMSLDSGRGDYMDGGPEEGNAQDSIKSSTADAGLEYIPKLQDIKKKYTEGKGEVEPKAAPIDEELMVIPKVKDIKERFMNPRADTEKAGSSRASFDEGEEFGGLAEIKRKLAEKKDQMPTVLSRPKAKKVRSEGDLQAIMASRRQVTDENNETKGAAEEIKSLASDITRTFGGVDLKEKWEFDLEREGQSKRDSSKRHKQDEKKVEKDTERIVQECHSKEEEKKVPEESKKGTCGKPEGCGTDDELDKRWSRGSDMMPSIDKSLEEEPKVELTDELVTEAKVYEVEAALADEPAEEDLDSVKSEEDDLEIQPSPEEEEARADEEHAEKDEEDREEDGSDIDLKERGREMGEEEDQRGDYEEEKEIKEESQEDEGQGEDRKESEQEDKDDKLEPESAGDETLEGDYQIEEEEAREESEEDEESEQEPGSEQEQGSEQEEENMEDEEVSKQQRGREEAEDVDASQSAEDSLSSSDEEVEDGAVLTHPTERPQSLYTPENKKTKALLLEERPKSYALGDLTAEDDPCLTSNLKAFADHRRKLRPARKHAPTTNPVRQRQNREDLRTETDILMSKSDKHNIQNADEMERPSFSKKRMKSGFTDEALAGLTSSENLASASVSLRKTQKDKSGISTEVNKLGGFQDVMLIQIKGARFMQTRLVEPTIKSLNSGDVFVLVKPKEIHVWVGKDSSIMKKAKGMEVSTLIVKQKDLNCSANKVNIIEQGGTAGDDAKTRSFWKTLGGKREVTDAGEFPSDEEHEKSMTATNLVYRINCSCDPPELVLREDLSRRALSSDFLDNSQAYVTDFGSEVYLWLGRNCPVLARNKGVKLAHDLYNSKFQLTSAISPFDTKIKRENEDESVSVTRPPWALFGRMTARSETVLFREKFVDWPDHNVDYTQDFVKKPIGGSLLGSTGSLNGDSDESGTGRKRKERPSSIFEMKACDVSTMLTPSEVPSFVLEGFDVGRGDGCVDDEGRTFVVTTSSVKIWHIKEYSYQPLPEDQYGHFHSSEGYVVRWKYCAKRTGVRTLKGQQSRYEDVGRDKVAYFFWQGRDCTVNEKGAAALMTVELDSDKGPQVLVSQGKEPPCFARLFEGKMTIHTGKRGNEDEGDVDAMFILRNEVPEEVFLLQIPESVSALRSRTSFVVFHALSGTLFVWHGSHTPDDTADASLEAAKHLRKWYQSMFPEEPFRIEEIEEGEEKKDFWEALGGETSARSDSKDPVPSDHTVRVFQLGSSSGAFEAKEILNPARSSKVCPFPILQGQLYSVMQPAIFLVDNKDALYMWLGWWPLSEDSESRASTTGSAQTRWNYDRRLAMEISRDYAQELGRDLSKTYVIFAGLEPECFKRIFPFWEERPDVAQLNSDGGREDGIMLKLEAELAKLTRDRYTLEELLQRPLPEGVDPQKLENYLSSEDMQKAFNMTKKEFEALPSWKKVNIKKKAGLF